MRETFPKIYISQFNPFTNKDGDTLPGILAKETDIYAELQNFKTGTYSYFIKELRDLKAKEDRSRYKIQKLPAFTFGCSFKEGDYRKQANIRDLSGILYIDIDAKGCEEFLKERRLSNMNYTIQDMRDELFESLPCIFAGLSCSGTGVFLLIKAVGLERADVFEDVKDYIQENYKIEIDVACKDVARLTFATYDPGAKIRNWDTINSWVLSKEYLEKKTKAEEWRKQQKNKIIVHHNTDLPGKIISKATHMIKSSVEGERHKKILSAARLLGGYVGSKILDEEYVYNQLIEAVIDIKYDDMADAKKAIDWGIKHGKTSPIDIHIITPEDPQWNFYVEQDDLRQKELRKLYSIIHDYIRDGIPQTTLNVVDMSHQFYVDSERVTDIVESMYERFAYEFNVNNMPAISKVEAWLTGHYEFKRDIITDDLLGRPRGIGLYNPIRYENMWREMSKAGIKFKYDDLVRLLNSDYVPRVNTWEQYFEDIPESPNENDPNFDHIDYCASFIQCNNPKEQPYFQLMFKKMLVRTIKCALDDYYANRTVFVLVSRTQSNGKSTFIRWLNPFGYHKYYSENMLDDGKDSRIRISETFIYNLEELATISKIEINRLKATISQVGTRDRKPYGRQAENFVRRCSFYGSTNLESFLTDDTNTRWLCFNINKIDWSYQSKVDKDQMWRQAYRLYKSGYDCELSKDESSQRDKQNENFQMQTTEGELVEKYFRKGSPSDPLAQFMTCTTINERLLLLTKESRIKISNIVLGKALNKMNFFRTRKNNVFGYWVIPINQDPYMPYQDDGKDKEEIEIPF
jgi:hypothetical protein